jgi:hypothetical protein
MKPKKLYLQLPISSSELVEQDKREFRDVKPWTYQQTANARFLERDRVLRRSTIEVREPERNGLISDAVAGVLLVITLILIYLIGYVIFG